MHGPASACAAFPTYAGSAEIRDCRAQGGISTADRIVTVSPGYAWEIQTPEGGWGMEQMLGSRAYALNGVLNGIDTTDWNPMTDKHLEHKYGISNFSRGKVRRLAQQWLLPGIDGARLWLRDNTKQLEHCRTLQALNKAALQKELGLPERPEVSSVQPLKYLRLV